MSIPTTFTLNAGVELPCVGIGCWMGGPGKANDELADGLKVALDAGYRHFDTAAHYGNEEVVGKVLRESGVDRAEMVVTTKLWNDRHADVEAAFDESLEKMGLGYIDLYLMHWPQANKKGTKEVDASVTFVETWKSMEALLTSRKGKVRAIGVSNFSVKTLGELLKHSSVTPAVNQIETHPYNPDFDVVEFCKAHGIVCTAYTPLGQVDSPMLKDKDILAVTEEVGNGATAGQVILSWNVLRGVGVHPKSTNPDRARQNLRTLSLTDAQRERIDAISKDPKRHTRLNAGTYDTETKKVLGWSLEQLGTSRATHSRLGRRVPVCLSSYFAIHCHPFATRDNMLLDGVGTLLARSGQRWARTDVRLLHEQDTLQCWCIPHGLFRLVRRRRKEHRRSDMAAFAVAQLVLVVGAPYIYVATRLCPHRRRIDDQRTLAFVADAQRTYADRGQLPFGFRVLLQARHGLDPHWRAAQLVALTVAERASLSATGRQHVDARGGRLQWRRRLTRRWHSCTVHNKERVHPSCRDVRTARPLAHQRARPADFGGNCHGVHGDIRAETQLPVRVAAPGKYAAVGGPCYRMVGARCDLGHRDAFQ